MANKQNKYDRQLRLWGDHGQWCLENSKICLVNVTATGTETLKNLILPGIGSFVIVDKSRVNGEDAGSNFFLDPNAIGESKAKVATNLLLELNPEVKGEYIEEDVANILETNPHFFLSFTVVIACNLYGDTLQKLAALFWCNNIPFVTCKSFGFIGYLRLVIPEHCIIESHPDNSHEDLRLDCPFEELCAYADTIDLDAMDKKDHSHTPYVIILYKYLMEWKKAHSGAMPKTWKEKKEFKKLVMSGIRKNADGVPEDEENFDEAVKQVNSALVPSCVPAKVQKIFNDPKCLQITEESTDFWMMVGGLRQFVSNSENGLLPLRGSLPDMFSDSDKYIKLQNIYQGKAKQDMEAVTGHISQVCTKSGCGNGKISEKDIKRFCRNAHFLRVVRTRSLQSEYESPSKSIMDCLTSDEISDAVWYVLLRAVERFQSTNGRLPGMNNAEWESDVNRLKNCLYDLLKSWDIPGAVEAISDDFLQEMCRCGSSEIHSVASYMGGVTSHEVVKLITSQYIPICNSYIYNGYKSTSVTIDI